MKRLTKRLLTMIIVTLASCQVKAIIDEHKIDLKAGDDYVYWKSDIEGKDLTPVKRVFDFGGSPIGANIKISNIYFEEVVYMSYDDAGNLWKAVDDGSALDQLGYYFADNYWTPIDYTQATHSGNAYELTLPEGLGGSQWQGQFAICTKLTANASMQYNFQLVMETDQDCPQVTIKLTDSGDTNFFCEGRHDIPAGEPFVFTLKGATLKEGTDASAIRLFFDFGGSPAGTNVKISKIIFKEAVNQQFRPASVGDMLTAKTIEGVDMVFMVTSVEEKTCIVGAARGEGEPTVRAISDETSGNVTIPESVDGYTVTAIGDQAFIDCSQLTSLIIPNTVSSIGNGAFGRCSKLAAMEIPNSVTSLGKDAFSGCYRLKSVILPQYITTIKLGTFWECYALESIEIPESVTVIERQAFQHCTSLNSIEIPKDVVSIGAYAFQDCTNLKTIVSNIKEPFAIEVNTFSDYSKPKLIVPAGCKEKYQTTSSWKYFINIEEMADEVVVFNGDVSLNWGMNYLPIQLTPEDLEKLGDKFSMELEYVQDPNAEYEDIQICEPYWTLMRYFADGVFHYGDFRPREFYGETGKERKTVFKFTEKVLNFIRDNGFVIQGYGASIHKVSFKKEESIPELIEFVDSGTKNICLQWDTNGDGELSYDEAASVTDLEGIGYYYGPFDEFQYFTGVTVIKERTFQWHGLTSITIPSSVTSIEAEAFQGCYNLTTLTIPYSVRTIGSSAFAWCSILKTLSISNSVTSIGDLAFSGCIGLTSIAIPNSVTSIGLGAFDYCCGLTSITVEDGNPVYDSRGNCNAIIETATNTIITGCISTTFPNSVTSIGSSAFSGCSGLSSITIPKYITSIGTGAFSGCSGLISIIVEDGNPVYDSRENCNAIIETETNTIITGCNSTVIPNTVTSIGNSAFSGCSGLTSISIPNSVTSIGSGAFNSCIGLTSISIPNSVTSIGSSAFSGCSGLTSISIPNFVTSIGSSAFSGCSGLTSISIPNFVTSIGDMAFYGCYGLISISIPNSVTSIGFGAFWSCTRLVSVTIPNSVISIGDWAFMDCSGLISISIPNSVASIGSMAFYNSTSLSSVIIRANWIINIGRECFDDYRVIKVYVHSNLVQQYQSDAEWGKYYIVGYTPGDANADGETNILDAVEDVKYILEQPTDWFDFYGGDINEDDVVDISDVMGIVDVIVHPATVTRSSSEGLSTDYDELTLDAQADGNLSLSLNNRAAYTAFQMDVLLSDGSTLSDVRLNTQRRSGHQLAYSQKSDGKYVIVGYSLDKSAFKADSGELLSFCTDAENVTIDNIHFVTTDNRDKWFETLKCSGSTTNILPVKEESDKAVYYNLNGRQVKSARGGIYIKNGKKIVVR